MLLNFWVAVGAQRRKRAPEVIMDKTQKESPKLDVPPDEGEEAPSTFDEFIGQERIKTRL